MKYQDKFLTINAEAIPLFDTDRPSQALIDLFNTPKNTLLAQSTGLVCRVNGILHEFSESFSLGINDTRLHCYSQSLSMEENPAFRMNFLAYQTILLLEKVKLQEIFLSQ